MCLDRSFDLVTTVLAIWKAGGTYVPLDPGYPAARLTFMLADSRAAVVVTRAALRGVLPPGAARVLDLDAERAALAAYPASAPPCAAGELNLAYLIYTSGSTGRPKGVAVPHRLLNNLARWQDASEPLRPGARVLQFAALSFDVSLQELVTTWAAGGRWCWSTTTAAATSTRWPRRSPSRRSSGPSCPRSRCPRCSPR